MKGGSRRRRRSVKVIGERGSVRRKYKGDIEERRQWWRRKVDNKMMYKEIDKGGIGREEGKKKVREEGRRRKREVV